MRDHVQLLLNCLIDNLPMLFLDWFFKLFSSKGLVVLVTHFALTSFPRGVTPCPFDELESGPIVFDRHCTTSVTVPPTSGHRVVQILILRYVVTFTNLTIINFFARTYVLAKCVIG